MWVGEGTQIEPGARLEPPILIGAGCLVEAEAELIGPLVVGDGCVIERGAVLEGVIHWDGVKAGRSSPPRPAASSAATSWCITRR